MEHKANKLTDITIGETSDSRRNGSKDAPKQASRASAASEFLYKEEPRSQSFDLRTGAMTTGHDRSDLNDIIFKDGIQGQTILDIGSYLGYFCVEAMKRGAKSATGIDPDIANIRQATAIANLSGVSPEYIHGDFEEWNFGDTKYDTVLCLDVLHHMLDAPGAIQIIQALARRKVVIEFASLRPRHIFYRLLNPLSLLAAALPVIYLGDPQKNHQILSRSFLFTRKAMQILFNKHTMAFEPVSITRSPFKGRLLLVANKRNVGDVLYVVGPTASGKSTLFRNLMKNAGLRSQYRLPVGDWVGLHSNRDQLPNGRLDRLMVHYDMLRPFGRSIRAFHRDPKCDLLHVAETTSFIAIMVKPGMLKEQLLRASSQTTASKLNPRHRDLYERYTDRTFMLTWWNSWIKYIERFEAKTYGKWLCVRDDNGERIVALDQWKKIFDAFYPETA